MHKLQLMISVLMLLCVAHADEKQELLKTRERVWRTWFANDVKALDELVLPDTIVISAGEHNWKNQAEVFAAGADFQRDGDVAVIYSEYVLELET